MAKLKDLDFNDIDVQMALGFREMSEDYYDPETFERLSKFFSKVGITSQGFEPEFERGTNNLIGAAEKLEKQLIEKASPGKRTALYKMAAIKFANMLIHEAESGLSSSWDNKAGGAVRADRALGFGAKTYGTTPKKFGALPKVGKISKELFNVSMDLSQAYDFIAKARRVGDFSKVSGFKQDLRNIIFKRSALEAAKGAVSDIITDIYIQKAKGKKSEKPTRQLLSILNVLIGSIEQLSLLKRIVDVKSKEINTFNYDTISGKAPMGIELTQSFTIYFDNLKIRINYLISEINSFIAIRTPGVLVSAMSEVTELINQNKLNQQKLIDLTIGRSGVEFLRSSAFNYGSELQSLDRYDDFSKDIKSSQTFFFEIERILNNVSSKINRALSIPLYGKYGGDFSFNNEKFEDIMDLVGNTTEINNPSYSGLGGVGATKELQRLEIHGSRFITERQTQDSDILEILYSVTDNLSLVFDNETMDDNNIASIKEAIGSAIFDRNGLESEIGNYLTGIVEGQFEGAKL